MIFQYIGIAKHPLATCTAADRTKPDNIAGCDSASLRIRCIIVVFVSFGLLCFSYMLDCSLLLSQPQGGRLVLLGRCLLGPLLLPPTPSETVTRLIWACAL